jgi:hypothetical protein
MFNLRRIEKRQLNRRFGGLNQSGQGAIEYILLLFVAVFIMLGTVYQFNDAFQKWAANYFGEYLACLMEAGELPNLGAPQGGSVCDQLYEPFNIASGRPSVPTSGGGGNSASSRSGRSSAASNSTGDDTASSVGRASRIPVSRGGAGGGRRGGSYGSRGGGSSGGFGSGSEGGSGDDSSYTGSSESSIPTAALGRPEKIKLKKPGELDRGFGFGAEDKKKKKKKKVAVKRRTASEGPANERKALMKVKRAKKERVEVVQDDGWSLGGIFRYLVIIAIILALVIFLGGQALQISKSME